MNLRLVNAVSLTVCEDYGEGRSDLPGERLPTIVIEFLYPIAQALATTVLPHARPEHAFVGHYLHADGKMTLGAYLVIPVSKSSGTLSYLLGTERDMDDDEWRSFKARMEAKGGFQMSCGIFVPEPNGTFLTRPEWFLKPHRLYHQDVKPFLSRAVGVPGL